MSQIRLAGCIITNDAEEILLLHRNTPKRVQWEIPGGKIDDGESEAEAAVREIKEELGADLTIVRRLGGREFVEDGTTMSYGWYLGRIVAGTPLIGEPATFDDLRYFGLSELVTMRPQLSGNLHNFLDAWIAGEFTLDR